MRNGLAGGQDRGPIASVDPTEVPACNLGRYSSENVANLLSFPEVEKRAVDEFEVVYDLWGHEIFDSITTSEGSHHDAVQRGAEKLGLEVDAIVFEPASSLVNEDPGSYVTA